MRLRVILQVGVGTTLVVLAVLVAGCAAPSVGDDCVGRYEPALADLRSEIDAEIGAAEASSVEACRVLPLGKKPCGGPWTYLIYSAEASEVDRLEALAAEYYRIDYERNRVCGLASDCMVMPAPTPTLEGGRCVVAR